MSYATHRVNDILRRMEENRSQGDTMKTCFGILAILSREDQNKQLIARDGMETILTIMISHLDKIDVQESGCDLLWSLAFNNIAIKDIIAEHGGASVVVSALKRHCKSPDFLKSACGALSNMCQSKLNQQTVAAQGGLRPLVESISLHQINGKLLLFIFDALASLIVGNEDNAKMVSSMGFIPLVLQSIGQHKTAMDVVKSACHTLAILSDVKGQASSVAFAGGVPVILSLLDMHSSYAGQSNNTSSLTSHHITPSHLILSPLTPSFCCIIVIGYAFIICRSIEQYLLSTDLLTSHHTLTSPLLPSDPPSPPHSLIQYIWYQYRFSSCRSCSIASYVTRKCSRWSRNRLSRRDQNLTKILRKRGCTT